MVIGIYKPGKKVYFYENTEDHASWSAEVTNIAKIFVNHGHHVIMLSETDLINSEHLTTIVDRPIDRIYVYNGVGPSDDEIKGLKVHTNDIRLIITDLKLVPDELEHYTHIYTQSKQLHEYGAIEQNPLVNYQEQSYPKDIKFYFGGTERNRLKEIIEYIYRPGIIWKGKSSFFDFNNYIPYHEHVEMLKRTEYTIVIGDETYNEIGFVTPRFYECAMYGVIPFVSNTFDKDELILPANSYLRVNSYKEMIEKMRRLDEDADLKKHIVSTLSLICNNKSVTSGDEIYKKLI